MKITMVKKSAIICSLICIALFLSSCVSKPVSIIPDPFYVLGNGEVLYGVLPVKEHTELLRTLYTQILQEGFYDDKEVEKNFESFVERSNYIYFSISSTSISILIDGNFPKSFSGLAFSKKGGWNKKNIKSLGSWYENIIDNNVVRLAIPYSNRLILNFQNIEIASENNQGKDFQKMFARSMPSETYLKNNFLSSLYLNFLSEIIKEPVIGIVFSDITTLENSVFGIELGLALSETEMYLNKLKNENAYNLHFVFEVSDERAARGLAMILKLILGLETKVESSLLFVSGIEFSNDELVELIQEAMTSK